MLSQTRFRGFRGFARETTLDFAADAVILVGPNGTGKTSVFDGIQWALFGAIPRLRGTRDSVGEDYIRNVFSPRLDPEVTIYLSTGSKSTVVRRTQQTFVVADDDVGSLTGAAAEAWVSQLVAAGEGDSPTAAVDAFERAYLLGQEKIVDFVRDTNPRDRFDSLSTLLGTDLVRRFYRRADQWLTTASSELSIADRSLLLADKSIEQTRLRRAASEAQIEVGSGSTVERIREELDSLGAQGKLAGLKWPSPSRLAALSGVLSSLRDLVAQTESGEARIREAIDTVQDLQAQAGDMDHLRTRLPVLDRERDDLRMRLSNLKADRDRSDRLASDLRAQIVATDAELQGLQRDRRDFAQFLSLAAAHVSGDRCPVCEQQIDPTQVVRRLQQRMDALPESERVLAVKRAALQARARDAQNALDPLVGQAREIGVELKGRTSQLSADRRQLESWQSSIRELTTAWGVADLAGVTAAAQELGASLRRISVRLRSLLSEAMSIDAQARLRSLQESESVASSERQMQYERRARLEAIRSTLQAVTKDAKASELSIVREAIQHQLPTLRAIYQRLRPHPLLEMLDVRFNTFKDRGEVYYRASHGGTSGNVSMMFSSAQLNAVAVCVFVSLNLARPLGGLDLLLLDDPIQNMDDYNVLGLVDLLRSLKGTRQVIVSTHDEQIGDLLRRKLRPRAAGQRTITHRFLSLDEDAPRIMTLVDDYVPQPLLLQSLAS